MRGFRVKLTWIIFCPLNRRILGWRLMNVQVLFEVHEQSHGLEVHWCTHEFTLQDMNVLLSTTIDLISLTHPLKSADRGLR